MKRIVLAATVSLLWLLNGCVSAPLVTDATEWGHATLDEQREWVAAQIDDALGAVEPQGTWSELLDGAAWEGARAQILESAESVSCRPNHTGGQPRRLLLELVSPADEDVFAAAAALWAHWEGEGWVVRYVISPESVPDGRVEYFRADRSDGAGLAFEASETMMRLSIESSCSDHATVIYR